MKPVVVELDYTRGDLGHPDWNFYISGWLTRLLGLSCFVTAFLVLGSMDGLSVVLFYLAMLASVVGEGLIRTGRIIRESVSKEQALSRLVAEQAERIKKLEEQVATFSALPPPHTHAA